MIPWTDHSLPPKVLDLGDDFVEDPARIRPTTNHIIPWGPSIWVTTDPQTGNRMVLVGLQHGGGVWIWSPIPWNQELHTEIVARCGGVRHIIIPNKLRATHVKEWSQHFPKAKIYAPPDLELQSDGGLIYDFVLTDDAKSDYVMDIDQVIFRGSSYMDEIVFYHRPSQTILFADLIQKKGTTTTSTDNNSKMTWFQYWFDLQENQYCTPLLWQYSFWWGGQQELSRLAFNKIIQHWKPKQAILLHDDCIQNDGAMEMVSKALDWIPDFDFSINTQKVGEGMLNTIDFTTGNNGGNDNPIVIQTPVKQPPPPKQIEPKPIMTNPNALLKV